MGGVIGSSPKFIKQKLLFFKTIIMKVSTNELAVINLLVQVDNEGKGRTFPINELQTAMDVFNEMKKLVKEDRFTD